MTDQLKQPLSPEQEMLDLMRKREKREAAEAEKRELAEMALLERQTHVKESRQKSEQFVNDQILAKRKNCDHRKGTSGKIKWKIIDYDVIMHTFNNGVVQIKCAKCGHKSFPGDTREMCWGSMDNFARRKSGGKMVPNPTGKSYDDWYSMTIDGNTTNQPSSAEIITAAPTPMSI